ncbi:MAG TPA: sugar transferase [Ktedonobacteraceae bacterium]|jgi:lipopolysaccharide/colanic/teichoic acid biosynthesis glycosyltransferase|nr:sugar transferase [Ktedonobacteraceae bacterium]
MLPNLQEHNARMNEIIGNKLSIEYNRNLPYGARSVVPRTSFMYACWQVAVDFAFGLLGVLLLLLILPVMALLIYLDSPGPIFYGQERLGYMGKPFRIYKFRSMRPDAESDGRAIWAARHDTRITRVGRVLRATHLDELPQAFNILRREMSLVGPRPEREEFAREMEMLDPAYHDRLLVKPGLTGWAQVKFGYGEGDHSELYKLQYDLYYIAHRSCWFDVVIILKTLVEVLRFHGR